MIEVETSRGVKFTISPTSVTGWKYEDSGIYDSPFYRIYTSGKEFQISPESFEVLRPHLPTWDVFDKLASAQYAWANLKDLFGTLDAETQRRVDAMSAAMDALK